MVASLLLLPDFSLAAKVSNAVKRAATGKTAKSGSAKPASTAAGKSSAKAKAPTKSARSSGSASKSSRVTSASKASHGKRSGTATAKGASSSRNRTATARGRSVPEARAALASPAEELELPSSYAPGRAFSFGAGSPESRDLSLYCVHTGERLNIDYYVGGRYEPGALAAIDHLLRDYHNDEICQFDPRVLNQLFDLRRALGSMEPFHVFSGYRSPTTNESYRRMSGRVAEHSYHMTGQAIDVQLPGRDVRQLRNVAVAMRSGGVGYYPQDGFLHLDSGPVRRW